MPWPIHRLPAYRKHRASRQAVVTIHGRDHYLGPHGTVASRLAYDRVITEYLASGRSEAFGVAPPELTLVTLIADYRRYAAAYYGTGRASEYRRMGRILKRLRSMYGNLAAAEFGVQQFKAVRQAYLNEDVSRTYVNDSMRRLVRFFRWAAAEGRIPAAVPQNLAAVPALRQGHCGLREAPPVTPVADEVVAATLPYLPSIVADMVRLQRLTGMRPAEVCLLRPADLDRSEPDVWVYRPARHKTEHLGRRRTVFIGPQGQRLLEPYLARGADEYCFQPREAAAAVRASRHAARRTPLSCGNRPGSVRKLQPQRAPGVSYSTDSYRRAIHRACDQAFVHPTLGATSASRLSAAQRTELKTWQSDHRWSPNQLRHAAATEIRRRYGLEAAQVMLGHSRADVTQIYAERDAAKGREVARELG